LRPHSITAPLIFFQLLHLSQLPFIVQFNPLKQKATAYMAIKAIPFIILFILSLHFVIWSK